MHTEIPDRPRTTNDLCTPGHVLDVIRSVSPIALDPCSNPWSRVDAAVELRGETAETDGLTADWKRLADGGLVFVNPPYGRGFMRQWAHKIAREARAGTEIIALVKGDHSTEWWRILRGAARAICYWDERIAFDGGDFGSGNFASTFVYCGLRPHAFAHVFAGRGDVRVIGGAA